MKKHGITILLALILLAGMGLLLYPSVSNYWNSRHQTRVVAAYQEDTAGLDDTRRETLWQEAEDYNRTLTGRADCWELSETEYAEYEKLLDISGTGVMGVLEIPRLQVSIPIYHGVEEQVLQVGVGHLPGSSLPTGGEGVHTVLSGHRGLPSAKLLTHLDKLEKGDCFTLQVLDRSLRYEVDQIRIVEPENVEDLVCQEGEDLCTLVTCTPYGVNSHRLLVRGHRVDPEAEKLTVITSDALRVEPLFVASVLGGIFLLMFLAGVCFHTRKRHAGR